MKNKPKNIFLWGVFSLTLAIALLTIVGYLSKTPYPGFLISENGISISKIFDLDQPGVLKPGDQLISINGILISDYQNSLTLQYWQRISPGDPVTINLLRDDQQRSGEPLGEVRRMPEFRYRFFSPMWVALILWGVGAGAYMTVQPRDHNSALFLYFCCVLADWLGAHYGPAEHHLWYNPILERLSSWLLVPLIFSFTWQFPNQLRGKKDGKVQLPIVISGYLLASALLVYDLLHPTYQLYRYALLISLLCSIGLIIFRYLSHTESRKQQQNIYFFAIFGYLILGGTLILEIINMHLPPLVEGIIFFRIAPLSNFNIIYNLGKKNPPVSISRQSISCWNDIQFDRPPGVDDVVNNRGKLGPAPKQHSKYVNRSINRCTDYANISSF